MTLAGGGAKRLVTVALLTFTACSILWIVLKETGAVPKRIPAASPSGEGASSGVPRPEHRFAVYYFTAGKRCSTCLKLERCTREAVEKGFPDLVRQGRLFFETVDCDLPPNRHYIDDYELAAKSVVLVELRGGKRVRWRKLEGIWERLRDREGYIRWIRAEVRSFMEGK